MENKYVDIRVVGGNTEIHEFLNVLRFISHCGYAGAHREMKVSVDGDGSARMGFYVIDKEKPCEEWKEILDENGLYKEKMKDPDIKCTQTIGE